MEFREVFRERWFNISNSLSVLRILLIPLFYHYSIDYSEHPADVRRLRILLLIIALATLTDFLDGFLARLLGQETRMGRYLDPISDKLVSISSLVILTIFYGFPLWVLGFYIFREIGGVWMGTFLYFRRDIQGKPNIWGKVGVFNVALLVLWYVGRPWLATRFPEGHLLLHPEYSAYSLVLILSIGMVVYWITYWDIVFHPEKAVQKESR